MFWNFIRWGGTAAIVLLVLAAVFIGASSEQTSVTPEDGGMVVPAEPAEATPPQKNFNL